MIYALDSDVISYILKGDAAFQTRFRAEIEAGNYYAIPPLAYYEVKRGLTVKKAVVKLREFNKLCENGIMGVMDTAVWDAAIGLYAELRRRGAPAGDADIFIAAYCLVNDYTLATNNTRHFEAITGLRLTNWK
jgi:predicted nucleic acid-binding protein